MLISEELYLEHHGVMGMKWGIINSASKVHAGHKLAKKIIKQNKKLYSHKASTKVGKEKADKMFFNVSGKESDFPIGTLSRH